MRKLNLRIEVAFLLNSFEIGEWQTVDAAQQADAIQLFVRNAQRVQTRFSFSQANLASVTRICRLVEGMPLGIELAAAWVDALPPDGIADEIDRNYQFLETQSRDIPARHRSMWATFQSSWDRLASDERLSLSRMAVFSGDFTYPAAQAVAGANLRTLQTLINKSMLTYRNDGRYHMHNLLRQYLNSQLLPAELTEHRRAYFQYYLLWLHERESAVKGNGQRKALDAIEREFDNLRTAWNYAIEVDDAAAIYQGLEGFFWFCMMRNRYLEGETLLQNALRQFVPIDDLSARLNLYYLWLRRWREGSFLPRKLVIEQLTELSTVFQRCADLANLAKCNLLLADALSAGKVDYERSSTRMAHD